ncbi:MAG: hypothetical protein IKU56_03745 [Clostridia bacterium]|nr:hypothetical protein [Clostridia bacterium]
MAIAEDVYARCRLCTVQAATILTGMINGVKIEPIAVQARRTAADIAGDTVYALLGRAFITPIDREDLWLLHETAEHVWCEAENTALLLYHCDRQLPRACEAVVRSSIACCTAARQIAEAFPTPDTTTQQMRALREAQRIYHTTVHSNFTDATIRRICEGTHRVITACEQLIGVLRYTAMKSG